MNSIAEELVAEEEIKTQEPQHKVTSLTSSMEAPEGMNYFRCYQFYSHSDKGKVKETNQDSLFFSSVTTITADKKILFGMASVADGMGGLAQGEIASAKAIAAMQPYMYARIAEYISEGVPDRETIIEHVTAAIQNANRAVFQQGLEQQARIGTTLTYVFLVGRDAYVGQVGDSRAYVIDSRDGSLVKLTNDHSLVGKMVELGNLTESESHKHPRKHEIYRMLGLRERISVDIYTRKIQPDEYILLVSDGLWECVEEVEIQKEFHRRANLQEVAEALVNLANEKGGGDNISVLIIQLKQ